MQAGITSIRPQVEGAAYARNQAFRVGRKNLSKTYINERAARIGEVKSVRRIEMLDTLRRRLPDDKAEVRYMLFFPN